MLSHQQNIYQRLRVQLEFEYSKRIQALQSQKYQVFHTIIAAQIGQAQAQLTISNGSHSSPTISNNKYLMIMNPILLGNIDYHLINYSNKYNQ